MQGIPDKNISVACIGAITVDQRFMLADDALPGTSNPASRALGAGGVAHNVARNLLRLNCAARLVTVVGDDSEGRELLAAARAAGVDVSLCASLPSARSGSYTAVLEVDGSLHIGVSDLAICDAMEPAFLISRWQKVSASSLLFADCNLPPATLTALCKRCLEEGQQLAVDAVSVRKSARLPRDLRGIDLLFANRDEAAAMTNNAKAADAIAMAQTLCARGAGTVVITDGGRGLHWARSDDSGSLPAVECNVRDVSGAGDALVAACLVGQLQKLPLQECLKLGLRAASQTATVPGSVDPGLQLGTIQADAGTG